MREIDIDIETYSEADLKKCGVYVYSEHPSFEILLFGYSTDGGPVKVIDIANGEKIPVEILEALTDENITKYAHNATFERVCLSAYLRKHYPQYFKSYSIPEDSVGNYLNPESWKCSMIWASYLALPRSLKDLGRILKLDEQKMSEGEDLIKYFCKPCRPTIKNGGRTRNLPEHDKEKWELFKKYNKRDVEVELGIKAKLSKFPVPDFVWDEYHLDQEINDRGILVDMTLVENAIAIDAKTKDYLRSQMQEKTGLDNPNSVSQMKGWLSDQGIETESLDKKAVKELLSDSDDDITDVLTCRQQLAKSSVSKYTAMKKMACSDNRARGCFQFYGANRTGRWSGRGIQIQNLVQNHMPDLAEARFLVRDGNMDALEMIYDNIPNVLSELIRTAFIPKPGYKYVVADFSAIEARVLSFLAGEQWRIDLFANGGDIYCQSASQMFGVPVVKNGINGHLRQKGKIAELACIAEGSPVLTDRGLIPIEKVRMTDKVWDGENWVTHEGVIYKGEREVIEYEGLTATPDHLVWVERQSEPIQFGIAAANGAHLVQTGDGRRAIRLGENNQPREKMEQKSEPLLCADRVSGMRNGAVADTEQSAKRNFKGMPELLSTETDSEMAGQKTDGSKTTLRKSTRRRLSQLWSKRDKVRLSECNGGRTLFDSRIRASGSGNRNRQDQYKRKLRSGESTVCESQNELHKSAQMCSIGVFSRILALFISGRSPKVVAGIDAGRNNIRCGDGGIRETEKLENNKRTARLYDIRNAGPYHRFTVSNRLVHNCGYGGGVGALKAMGALEMGLTEEELQPLVTAWRNANPRIVDFWWNVDRAVKDAVRYHSTVTVGMFRFYYQSGMLFIDLPSGRRLCYVKPKMGQNQFGGDAVTYEGINTGKWMRLESYGPKFVENIVQAVSRDILAYAMKTLRHCFIVGSVHDELIIECSPGVDMNEVCKQMGRTPPWIEGIQLRADGYECQFYKKE